MSGKILLDFHYYCYTTAIKLKEAHTHINKSIFTMYGQLVICHVSEKKLFEKEEKDL